MGMSAKGGNRFVGVASGIVYDIDQNAGRSISMRRKLDEPVYPLDSTEEALAEYGDLLDREAPIFFASGQLPSIARWWELLVALVGPGVWKIYGDLAPDFTKAIGPISFPLESLKNSPLQD